MLAWVLNLGFAASASTVTPPAPQPTTGGSGGARYFTPRDYEPRKKRKFTRKDENELKRLLLQAAEDDLKAQAALRKKAEDLQKVSGAITGVKEAVDAATETVRAQARADEITRKKAKELLEEIYEEEEILLEIIRFL